MDGWFVVATAAGDEGRTPDVAHALLHGVVALDGPSGTGKSTVARRLAAEFGAAYLDTGAMYRAITLAALREGIEPTDSARVVQAARSATVTVGTDPKRPTILLDGENVGEDVRGPMVTAAVSTVSAILSVRELMVAEQRRLIREALRSAGGVVVEGRDIGTVVVPDAALKVYLTAAAQVRASRRSAQDVAAGRSADLESVHTDLQRRDALDAGRAVSPSRPADDAIELDTTQLDVTGVLEQLHKLVERRGLLIAPERTVR
jgi:CMP/dCMP kinase